MAPSGRSPAVAPPFLRLSHPLALIVSVAAHAALLLAVARLHWPIERAAEPERPSVVWLREWPVAIVTPPEPAPPREQPAEPLAPPPGEEAPQPEPEVAPPEPEPEPEPTPRPVERAEVPVPDEPAEERAAERAPEEAPSEPGPQPRGRIDWEAERRKAIEELRTQRDQEGEVYSFSFEEIPDAVVPEEPEPDRPSVFDRPVGGGRSALRPPEQARTKVGRAVSELCQALLGGGEILGGFSLCGEAGDDVDFFPYIRPLHAEGRPECEILPDEVHPPSYAAAADEPVIKCRIVVDPEELAEREATRPDNVALPAR